MLLVLFCKGWIGACAIIIFFFCYRMDGWMDGWARVLSVLLCNRIGGWMDRWIARRVCYWFCSII